MPAMALQHAGGQMVARDDEDPGRKGPDVGHYSIYDLYGPRLLFEITVFSGNVRLLDVHEKELVPVVMLSQNGDHLAIVRRLFLYLHAQDLC